MSHSRISCLSIQGIVIQGVFSTKQPGIGPRKCLHRPLLALLTLKVTDCLHIPHEEMEAQRAELELPQDTVNALQGRGHGPCLASWSNPPPLYHAVYELVLQELNTHHMLWTLQEDLTTPRDLEPNPL